MPILYNHDALFYTDLHTIRYIFNLSHFIFTEILIHQIFQFWNILFCFYKQNPMKSTKSIHTKTKIQKIHNKTRTNKQIQAKLLKQQFFSQVAKQLSHSFIKDDLQFLFQSMQNLILHNKKRLNQNEEPNRLQIHKNQQTQKTLQEQTTEDNTNPFKKMHTNIFRQNSKRSFINLLSSDSKNQNRQYFSTPKFTKTLSKNIIPRRIFDMERKMQRNYQRARQRLLYNNNIYEPLKPISDIRVSQTTYRKSKTQRGIRYKTQSEESDTKFQQQFIPPMLREDLLWNLSIKKQNKHNFQQKRMQCFLRDKPVSPLKAIKKYRFAR